MTLNRNRLLFLSLLVFGAGMMMGSAGLTFSVTGSSCGCSTTSAGFGL